MGKIINYVKDKQVIPSGSSLFFQPASGKQYIIKGVACGTWAAGALEQGPRMNVGIYDGTYSTYHAHQQSSMPTGRLRIGVNNANYLICNNVSGASMVIYYWGVEASGVVNQVFPSVGSGATVTYQPASGKAIVVHCITSSVAGTNLENISNVEAFITDGTNDAIFSPALNVYQLSFGEWLIDNTDYLKIQNTSPVTANLGFCGIEVER